MANQPMGLGAVGAPDLVFKRKFRWTFQILGFCDNVKSVIPEYFVKVAARPKLSIEETEINFLNGKTWIPGKAEWETITVTYLDVANTQMSPLWNWLATLYNFTDPVNLQMGNKRDWRATGILSMYDGCGVLLEAWQLSNMFPTEVDFGDMDMSSSEIAEIELTLRYSDVIYKSYCPAFQPSACCGGCGSKSQESQFQNFLQ